MDAGRLRPGASGDCRESRGARAGHLPGDARRPGSKWGAENASLLFEYSDSTPRNDALFSIECRLLLGALEAAEAEGRSAGARRFLAVRRLRQGELEGRFVEFEKGLESNEGLAEYAGFRAIALAAENGLPIVVFDMTRKNAVRDAAAGDRIGTRVTA